MTAGLTLAVDAMSGDHGAAVAVPAALDVLASTPDLRLIIVGRGDVAAAVARGRGPGALHARRGERSRRHGRAAAGRPASQERFLDARGDQSRQARRGGRLHLGGQHRGAARHGALRARHGARHRPSGHRLRGASGARTHCHARSRREPRLHGGASRAVRRHGFSDRCRPARRRPSRASRCSTLARKTSRAPTRFARRTGAWPARRSTTEASSKVTTSSRVTWTSWSPMVSPATSR